MRDSDYIFAVARIRVLEKGLLSPEDIRQLVALKDTSAVLSFLRGRGWGDGSQDADGAHMLRTEEAKVDASIQDLGLDQRLLEVLDLPERYHNLKVAIKELSFGTVVPEAYYSLDGFGRGELTHAISAQEFSLLPDDMARAARRALDVMAASSDAQWCDVILDKACLQAMAAAAASSGSDLLVSYVRMFVQNADLKIVLRGARTGKGRRFLEEATCPVEGMDTSALIRHALAGEQELLDYLDDSDLDAAASAIRKSSASFEQWCESRLLDVLKGQGSNIMSPGPILAFVLRRHAEIRNVRILLTAKANGFGDDVVLERMCIANG